MTDTQVQHKGAKGWVLLQRGNISGETGILRSRRKEYLETTVGCQTIRAARVTKFSYTLREWAHGIEIETICI